MALPQVFTFATRLDIVLMFMGSIGAVIHGLALPLFLFIFGKLLNSLAQLANDPDEMYHNVCKYSLYFIYLAVIICFSSWAEVACWMQTGERQIAAMRIKYLEAILKQDVTYFDIRTGDFINKFSSNMVIIQEAISQKVGNFIYHVFTFVGGFTVGFVTLWQLGILTIAVIPIIVAFGASYALSLSRLSLKSQEAYSQAGNIAEEVISQIKTVKAFGGESKAVTAYASALSSPLKLGRKIGLVKGLGVGSTSGVLLSSWALLLWYGGVLVRRETANGGSVLSTILAVLIGCISLGQASPHIATFGKAKAAACTILSTIEQLPRTMTDFEGSKLAHVEGHIQLKDVCFSYPSRPSAFVFQGLSLDIPAGKAVAIVGGSGSGKSTIVSLIERFYDPTSGGVFLDGQNIKSFELNWLRRQIGLVSQEPILFATTIRENILYGDPNAKIEQVEEAAKAANASHFITQLPNGYETMVGERGAQLSGGQKQRIAIARSVIRRPSVFLFDEATSALDAESEHSVQEALDKLMVGHTTVVIAHRLSTVRNADIIVVLQDGKAVEHGTHTELISRGSAYASLVHLQDKAHQNRNLEEKSNSWRIDSSRASSFHSIDHPKLQTLHNYPLPTNYFGRLLNLNMPEWPFLVLGSFAAVLAGFVHPTLAFLISDILKVYYIPDKHVMKSEVLKYSLAFACVGVAVFFIQVVEQYSFAASGESLTKRVRELMFAAITKFETSWFDFEENGSAQVTAKLDSEATYVRGAMGDRMALFIQNGSLLASALILSYLLDWRLALVVTATLPLVIFSFVAEQMYLRGFVGDIAKSHENATKLAAEAVSNFRTVAAFNAQGKVIDLMRKTLDEPMRSNLRRGLVSGLSYGTGSFFLYSSMGLVLWYGGLLIKNHKSRFGDVVKAFFVLVLTSIGVSETLGLSSEMVKSGHALKSVFGILDKTTEVDLDDPAGVAIESIKGEIEFQNVNFNYPARPDVTIFQELSFKVKPGQRLALVGASGSGKSSIIALIQRFYDPSHGRVLVDRKNIRYYNLKAYRKHLGLVQQEPALFAMSIYDNIRYGKEDVSEVDIVKAAKLANAHTFISGLPNGYNTFVGERGSQLSGGQKQRIAIARAVIKEPSVLLLDEATSALDAEAENVVREALNNLMLNRTTVIVAHRLSMVTSCEHIAVIESGRIVEQGTHLELMAMGRAYSHLCDNGPVMGCST